MPGDLSDEQVNKIFTDIEKGMKENNEYKRLVDVLMLAARNVFDYLDERNNHDPEKYVDAVTIVGYCTDGHAHPLYTVERIPVEEHEDGT